jgi:hypothetical protein
MKNKKVNKKRKTKKDHILPVLKVVVVLLQVLLHHLSDRDKREKKTK